MRSSIVVLAFSAVAAVSGAALQARQNIPSCVGGCIGTTAVSIGCSASDAMCLCNSETFITNVAGCFGQQCSATDAAAGTALGQQLCAAIGISVSIPAAASSALAGAGGASGSASGSSIASSVAQTLTSSSSGAAATSAPASAASAATSAAAAAASSAAPTGAGFTLSANNALAGLAAVGAVLAAF